MNFFTLELVNFNTYLVIMFALNSREMEYNGIVLESWSRWAAYGVLHDPDLRKMVCPVISSRPLRFFFHIMHHVSKLFYKSSRH